MRPSPVDIRIESPARFDPAQLLVRLALAIALGFLGITFGWLACAVYILLPAIAAAYISSRGADKFLCEVTPAVAATYAPSLERAGEGRGPSDVVLHLAAGSGALYEVARLSGPFTSARGMAVTDDRTVAVAGSFANRLRLGSQPVAGAGGLDGFVMTIWLDVWGD